MYENDMKVQGLCGGYLVMIPSLSQTAGAVEIRAAWNLQTLRSGNTLCSSGQRAMSDATTTVPMFGR